MLINLIFKLRLATNNVPSSQQYTNIYILDPWDNSGVYYYFDVLLCTCVCMYYIIQLLVQ